jgi:hypothetical protein
VALIFGTVNPSGKLPVTFPASLSQVPAQATAQWPGTPAGPNYTEGVNIGYRWYQSQSITPAFPFGFGLSCTTFSFSNLNVGAFNANGQATATITSTGSKAGADVAQLYVGDPAASQDPPEQLAGFQRVALNPGQAATVTFPLTIHDLASGPRLTTSGRRRRARTRSRSGTPPATCRWPARPPSPRSVRHGHLRVVRRAVTHRRGGGRPFRRGRPPRCAAGR